MPGIYFYIRNSHFSPQMDNDELGHFTRDRIKDILHFQQTHDNYTETPLRSLTGLARHLNISDIKVKDESYRFGLNAFKVMGGIYGVGKYMADRLGRDIQDLSFDTLRSPEVRKEIGDITFISATDGNHGRAIAWAARELGQKAVIYLPRVALPSRLEAIQKEGAYAEITDRNYDDTVQMAAEMAEENGWVLIQDTAWGDYDEIPLWITQGYAAIALEVIQQIEASHEKPPTHVFLQAGAGSFAAGIIGFLKQYYGKDAPTFVLAEPDQADCYYRSLAASSGNRETVTGDMATIMAGLSCGVPSSRAFPLIRQYASAAASCDDSIAALGMRVMGNPAENDARIISGESGALPLGLLSHLCTSGEEEACAAMGLDEHSRVLVINTEGDTDPGQYRQIVWHGLYGEA